jgi:hypothetical protein
VEALMNGENLSQLRQRLFRVIFTVIARDQNHILAMPGSAAPFVGNSLRFYTQSRKQEKKDGYKRLVGEDFHARPL